MVDHASPSDLLPTDEGYTQGSDEVLLYDAREGDRRAAVELWNRHSPYGLAVVQGLAPEQNVESINTRAWVHLLSADPNEGAPGGFRPCLYHAIRTIAAPNKTIRGDVYLSPTYRSLREEWREVLWYTHMESMRPNQIATLMGVDTREASTLLHQARQGLRQGWVQRRLRSIPLSNEVCREVWQNSRAFARNLMSEDDATLMSTHIRDCETCESAGLDAVAVGALLRKEYMDTVTGVGGGSSLRAYLRATGPFVRALAPLPMPIAKLYGRTPESKTEPKKVEDEKKTRPAKAEEQKTEEPRTEEPKPRPARKPLAKPRAAEEPKPDDEVDHVELTEELQDMSRPSGYVGTWVGHKPKAPIIPARKIPATRREKSTEDSSKDVFDDDATMDTSPPEILNFPQEPTKRPVSKRIFELPLEPEGILDPESPDFASHGDARTRTRVRSTKRKVSSAARGLIIVVVILVILILAGIGVDSLLSSPEVTPSTPSTPSQTRTTESSLPVPVPPGSVEITSVDTGVLNNLFPIVSGRAEPHTEVALTIGEVEITVTTSNSGEWTTAGFVAPFTSSRGMISLRDGSSPSDPALAGYDLVPPPKMTTRASDEQVIVTLTGLPSTTAEILLDGNSMEWPSLDESGSVDVAVKATQGNHFLQVRYVEGNRVGPVSAPVTIS